MTGGRQQQRIAQLRAALRRALDTRRGPRQNLGLLRRRRLRQTLHALERAADQHRGRRVAVLGGVVVARAAAAARAASAHGAAASQHQRTARCSRPQRYAASACFLAGAGRDRDAQRHADAEMRAGEFAVDDFDGALMHVDELVDDRQSDAGAAHVAAGRAAGVERLEDARSLLQRDAGSAVGHLEHQLLAAAPARARR